MKISDVVKKAAKGDCEASGSCSYFDSKECTAEADFCLVRALRIQEVCEDYARNLIDYKAKQLAALHSENKLLWDALQIARAEIKDMAMRTSGGFSCDVIDKIDAALAGRKVGE